MTLGIGKSVAAHRGSDAGCLNGHVAAAGRKTRGGILPGGRHREGGAGEQLIFALQYLSVRHGDADTAMRGTLQDDFDPGHTDRLGSFIEGITCPTSMHPASNPDRISATTTEKLFMNPSLRAAAYPGQATNN